MRGRLPPALGLPGNESWGPPNPNSTLKHPGGVLGLLANLKTLELDQDLRKRRYCTVAWPQYRLDNQSQWPPEGTFNYQTFMDLNNLGRHQGRWAKVPYVQLSGLCTLAPSSALTAPPHRSSWPAPLPLPCHPLLPKTRTSPPRLLSLNPRRASPIH